MTSPQNITKERAACAAALGLLAITAYAFVADAARERSLPVQPTVGATALREAGDLEVGPQDYSRFWNFGPRNPFQPVPSQDAAAGVRAEQQHITVEQQAHTAIVHGDQDGAGRDRRAGAGGDNGSEEARHDLLAARHNADAAEQPFVMPLSFKAIVEVGERVAVLQDKSSGALTRCSIGDTLLGMTVRGICATSVIVQDRNGNLYELMDAFRRKYD